MVWLHRVGSLRSRGVFVLVVAATVVAACEHGADAPVEEPRSRLLALEDLWFASPATITYRTTERDPGEATSPHQCLRQLVEVDVQTGLRICSGVSEMRLAWDPPDRWRTDGASPDGSFTRLSTPEGTVRCRGTDIVASGCVAARSNGPFASVVGSPARILDEIGGSGGAIVSEGPRRTIAGLPAECFRADGGSAQTPHRVEWCFSRSGLLLYVSDGVEGGRAMTVEATEVLEGVSDRAFVVPSG